MRDLSRNLAASQAQILRVQCKSPKARDMETPPRSWQRVAATPSSDTASQEEHEQQPRSQWSAVGAAIPEATATAASSLTAGAFLRLTEGADPPKKRGRPSTKAHPKSLAQGRPSGSQQNPLEGAEDADVDATVVGALAAPPALAAPTVNLAVATVSRPKQGRMGLPTLLSALPAALAVAKQSAAAPDPDVEAIAKHFLDPQRFHLASKVVLQQLLGVSDPQTMKRKILRLAAAFHLQQIHERHTLEEQLAQTIAPASRILYCEGGAFDETPLRLTLKEAISADSLPEALSQASRQSRSAASGQPPRTQQLICKVLQTKATYGFLLQLSSGLVGLLGEHICPLQSMSTTSGEVLAECLARNSPVSFSADSWGLKCRAMCADRAGSNRRGEEILASHRSNPGSRWQSVLYPCDLHGVAGSLKNTYEQLLGEHLTGMIRLSLSLRFQNCWSLFRRALRLVIQQRMQFKPGHPPASVVKYKAFITSLCLQGSPSTKIQSLIGVLHVANGDWLNHDQVEVYWPEEKGAPPESPSARQSLVHPLVQALAPRQPRLWRRDKWTGFQEAVGDLLLIEGVHGLLTPTYALFLRLLKEGKGGGDKSSTADHEQGLLEGEVEGGAGVGEEVAPLDPEAAPEAAHSEEPVPGSGLGGEQAARNAKDRAAAQRWLHSKPLAHIMVIAGSLAPVSRLQHRLFKLSSDKWETSQRAQEARLLVEGKGESRRYRATELAQGQLDPDFAEDLYRLMSGEEPWKWLPAGSATFHFRAQSFRVLSRLGAAVHQLVTHPHQLYPQKLFLLLGAPSLGATLAADAECLKDDYTKELQRRYPNLEGDELQCVLKMHALHQCTDIGAIETKHASVRRQVVLLSVQTWRREFGETSCHWVLQNLRRSLHTLKLRKAQATAGRVRWGQATPTKA